MLMNQFLLIPENRETVRMLSERVLIEFEPEQAEVTVGFIDPLLEMASRGEVITVDTSDESGGFGGADLMVMVVVPVIVGVMSNLLTQGIFDLHQHLKTFKQEWNLFSQKFSALKEKNIPNFPVAETQQIARLIAGLKTERLSQQIKDLHGEWDILSQKLARLKIAEILETHVDEGMRLEELITELNTERQNVEEQLNRLETQFHADASQMTPINITYDDIRGIVERTGSPVSKRKIQQLTDITRKAIREYFDNEP